MRKFVCMLIFLAVWGMSTSFSSAADITPGAISHEQQWIVNSIGQDVAEIVLFASKQDGGKDIALDALQFETKEAPGNTEQFSYRLNWGKSEDEQKRDFTLVDYVWNPDNYAPWAEQIINSCKLHSVEPADVPPDTFIASLSNFTPETITQENKRISAALTLHPLDAGMHEQAALLSALFGLRESAACFSDVRPCLNRISAHLALAKALKGKAEYGTAGKLAEAVLMCLCGREAEAVARIDALNSDANPATQSWLRAIKIRATNDYRIADLKKASVLERLQYGRALADDIGSDYLTDYLQKNKPDGPAIDWLRIGSRGVGSVESGQIYAEPGVTAELDSFNADLKLYKGEGIKTLAEVSPALSLFAGRCLILVPTPELQVISWADLSAFHARHILDSMFQKYYFEKSMWGVPEQADEFAAQTDKTYSGIKLYPLYRLCRSWVDRKKCDAELTAQLKTILLDEPEVINSNLWHRILTRALNPGELPQPASWFVPRFPFGTAYDFTYRNFDSDPDVSLIDLDKLRSASPYSRPLTMSWLSTKYPKKSYTSDQLAEAYGALTEVDVTAMESVAYVCKADPVRYATLSEKIARYKPDKYFPLGDYYVEHSQPEKAKLAYEAGVRLCRDSLAMANDCSWLVDYYFDHKQADKAYKLAKSAAEVYSAAGLITMARLCERMGKISEAAEYFEQNSERYGDTARLCLFYNRHAKENANFKQEGAKLFKSIFPAGLVKVNTASLTGQPKVGIQVTSDSAMATKYGIHMGEVFVAIDGVQVETQPQYSYQIAASANSNKKIAFTVWNGKDYRTVEAVLPIRGWGCSKAEYKAGQ